MRRLWLGLGLVLAISFGLLLWVGSRIYQMAPPIPDRVVSTEGRVVFEVGEVSAGQDVWRSFGGMQLGSIWGHGSYVAPDWTADWLHRELVGVLDEWSVEASGKIYAKLDRVAQAGLQERLRDEIRKNTYDATARTITVSPHRARAIEANALAINGQLDANGVWWFGHSGYEYIDLGRIYQFALLAGLCLWVFLVTRALWPALKRRDVQRPLIVMLLISTIAIGGFYFAALGAGRHTNLAIVEYWRWWVVHLWVEGFFEVFATVIIAFLFARLGLVRYAAAGRASVLAATIFLAGGVLGTLHYLYFSGTPTIALAFGSVFSALEVVPLLFLGYDGWENWRHSKSTPWMRSYRWPIYFFIAVAFWNVVGAGLFGFMINPPVALYYMQGLNTTAVHAHTALFGVYGMLGLGLVLFTVKSLRPNLVWPDRLLKFAFWSINLGLLGMSVFSVLPVGLLQTWAAIDVGYWYARSSEFMQSGTMETLRWLRVVGDTIFAIGAFVFVIAVLRMTVRRRKVASATPDSAIAL